MAVQMGRKIKKQKKTDFRKLLYLGGGIFYRYEFVF